MDDMTEHSETTLSPAPGEPTTDRVHGIFSLIADRYDLFNILSSFGIDRLWRRATVRAANLDSSSRVLDVCAGTGDLSLALARQGHPAEVVGTDFVAEMLAVAEEKAKGFEGKTRLSFSVADAQDLPFPDASFDVVTVAFGVRNLPDRRANFAEVIRVLKDGGRYVILEFSRPVFAPWRWAYHLYLRAIIPTIGGLLTGDRGSFAYLNDSIRSFPPQALLGAELREAGFTTVTWENRTGGIVAIHTAVK
ncbi:MAG: bifunctional demethylmenaquinone methyltransferase/2-methoxy-6-polyprenyl-1,4-benzoquinol methylase UbiE [Coriobacteriia bacterium]|jgi:demethylmenaquinone methyltransferase/2-methoxy-6-polyprenyl-1,4-benzoquinol methylase|nr:bifunctional demethylmenaquinone methyltransferase/2-methoxy-6-polyprenyl-1,4-benzoquinol methylase UbiE [Coriobacteriia bacterium]